jgi:cytochrome c biogenesis protein CcmG, thiol:disulfide interchange protein DsbE
MAMGGIIALAALGTVAIWLAQSNSPTSSSDPLVGRTGQPAPAFSLRTLSNTGPDVTLATFRGKPLVINFWASWCVPCRTEMPLLEQAFRAEGGRVQFLGIDANDTPAAARDFLKQVHVAYPLASDETAAVATQFRLFGLPTTVFISPSGKIVGRVIGQLHGDNLRAALQEAFHA